MSSLRPFVRALVAALAFGAAGTLAACKDAAAPAAAAANATLPFYAVFNASAGVQQVVVTVTGPGISPALLFNIPVVNNVATDQLVVPVGPSRVILAQAFGTGGVELYRGQATINVVPGLNAAVNLVLNPNVGTVPINATIGAVTITLTPATATASAGSQLLFSATVRDALNNVVSTPVTFASNFPPKGWVFPNGAFAALDTGTVTISASALGASAVATVTLTAGNTLGAVTLAPATVSSAAGGTVNGTFAITDAGPVGVDSINVTLSGPTGSANCRTNAPISGIRTAGTWGCTFAIPVGAATGTWSITSLAIWWDGGQPNAGFINYVPAILTARGVNQTVTVTP